MERKKLFNNRLIITSGLLIAGLVIASAAEAGDRHRNHRRDDARRAEAREDVRDARDYDRRLDRRGRAIDAHLDVFALLAAATGNYDLAYELDRKGDRIERRLDRRGDGRQRPQLLALAPEQFSDLDPLVFYFFFLCFCCIVVG